METLNNDELKSILISFREGNISLEDAAVKAGELQYLNLGHTLLDTDRERRTGFPEAVFCQGKTTEQIRDIFNAMRDNKINILGTRMEGSVYDELASDFPEAVYNSIARIFTLKHEPDNSVKLNSGPDHFIAVVSAGTSDSSAAEEAAATAEFYGCRVKRFSDAGVAGLHRLLGCIDEIRKADVVIAAAGMEGALASVVGGLVKSPVIALPVSTGYGSGSGGYAALLAMLNSCASGLAVVNIDNGYGAACMACRIIRML